MASDNTDLPRALVSTIIKNKLAVSGPSEDPDKQLKVNLNKDALLAFVESAKVFISYLTATANDICHESKRQIINVDDVFNALEDIEFGEFVTPLKAALDTFREESKEKNAKKAERTKKRKQEEQAQAEAQEAEAQLHSATADDGAEDGQDSELAPPASSSGIPDTVMYPADTMLPQLLAQPLLITHPPAPPVQHQAISASLPLDHDPVQQQQQQQQPQNLGQANGVGPPAVPMDTDAGALS